MAVMGIGIDVVAIDRIERILAGPRGDRFVERVLTEGERRLAEGRFRRMAEVVAARFAAKEAFAKSVGAPKGLGWHDVEVVRAGGKPTLLLTGAAARVLLGRRVRRLHLSLSHDAGMAAAVVVLES